VHYNYYRTYDPSTGRYIESDPIGLSGGANTFSYVGNNSMNRIDPFGLRELTSNEKDFLRSYYGGCLNIDEIDLKRTRRKNAYSPNGHKIRMRTNDFVDGDPSKELRLDDYEVAALFAHEARHVQQREQGRNVTLIGLLLQAKYKIGGVYVYSFDYRETDPDKMLNIYDQSNIEAQGAIVETYVSWDRRNLSHAASRFSKVADKLKNCGCQE
jgi:uncharacterized protein RhaS with RHS repeats